MRTLNLTATGGWQRIGTGYGLVGLEIQARTAVDVQLRTADTNDEYWTIKSDDRLRLIVRDLSRLELLAAAGTVIEVLLF